VSLRLYQQTGCGRAHEARAEGGRACSVLARVLTHEVDLRTRHGRKEAASALALSWCCVALRDNKHTHTWVHVRRQPAD